MEQLLASCDPCLPTSLQLGDATVSWTNCWSGDSPQRERKGKNPLWVPESCFHVEQWEPHAKQRRMVSKLGTLILQKETVYFRKFPV